MGDTLWAVRVVKGARWPPLYFCFRFMFIKSIQLVSVECSQFRQFLTSTVLSIICSFLCFFTNKHSTAQQINLQNTEWITWLVLISSGSQISRAVFCMYVCYCSVNVCIYSGIPLSWLLWEEVVSPNTLLLCSSLWLLPKRFLCFEILVLWYTCQNVHRK